MRKVMIGVAAVAAAMAAVLLGPALVRRGMNKCHEMMAEMRSEAGPEPVRLRTNR